MEDEMTRQDELRNLVKNSRLIELAPAITIELAAALDELAAAKAEVARLRDFIADFSEADFTMAPRPHVRHPADEPDPFVDAGEVWAWQEDARAALSPEAHDAD